MHKKYTAWYAFQRQMRYAFSERKWYLFVLYFLGSISGGIATVLMALFSKYIVDIVQGTRNTHSLIQGIWILSGMAIVCFAVTILCKGWSRSVALNLRLQAFCKIITLFHRMDFSRIENPKFEDEFHAGLQTMQSDDTGFQAVYTRTYTILTDMFTILLCIAALSRHMPWMSVLFAVLLICTGISNYQYAAYCVARKPDQQRQYRKSMYYTRTLSDFAYGKDIRIFSLRPFLMQKFKEVSDAYVQVVADIQKKYILYGFIALAGYILQFGVAWYMIAHQYFTGFISLSTAILYFNILAVCSSACHDLVEESSSLLKDLQYSKEYFAMYDRYIPKEEKGKRKALDPDIPAEIVFDHVWFRYPDTQNYVLKDFSFKIHAGEKLAIVGANGAGKSTIVKLMTGLYTPEKGHIYINGTDSSEFYKEEYYKMFSTVFQDFEIYPCTLVENVCGKDTDERSQRFAQKCLDTAGLKDKIDSLPQGYDSIASKVLDEKGIDLSGGQKQKVAIARALYKNGNVVVLDEPTAALDALAEAQIYQNLNTLVEGKTSVYISHRLSSTKFCDHIALLGKNGVEEYGTHEELMAKHGKYYELFEIQGKYYQEEMEQ